MIVVQFFYGLNNHILFLISVPLQELLTTRPKAFLNVSLHSIPQVIDAGDIVTLNISAVNVAANRTAYDVNISVPMNPLLNLINNSCRILNKSHSKYVGSTQDFITSAAVKSQSMISCHFNYLAKDHVKPRELLRQYLSTMYYLVPKSELAEQYPYLERLLADVKIYPVNGQFKASKNTTTLLVGDYLEVNFTLSIPQCITPLVLRYTFGFENKEGETERNKVKR